MQRTPRLEVTDVKPLKPVTAGRLFDTFGAPPSRARADGDCTGSSEVLYTSISCP